MIGTIATDSQYIGRFAPSPTGPLHFGSLLAAVASYLQARQRGGRWLLRIENIDPPREQAGAAAAIIDCMSAYGFVWDGPVLWQRDREARHHEIVAQLIDAGLAYRCGCSRRDLAGAAQGAMGAIYPGTCRSGCTATDTAIRIRTHNRPLCFTDALQGEVCQQLESELGDFIIRRRDGLIAYQLAVVVDDFEQSVTEVVRGIDLMDSTPRQIHLQQLLQLPTPEYSHIPVILNDAGQKLSKNTGAAGLPLHGKRAILVAALAALAQHPPDNLAGQTLAQIWRWATEHWNPGQLRGLKEIAALQDALVQTENGLS